MRLRHNNESGQPCDFCEEELKGCHLQIANWFKRAKARFPHIHISCGYRGPIEQARAYNEGRSNAPYPKSPHNMTVNTIPCSCAVDIFVIDEDGIARWPFQFYQFVDAWNKQQQEPIKWGGEFKKLRDGPHFELKSNSPLIPNSIYAES